jgi:hypothetical protein
MKTRIFGLVFVILVRRHTLGKQLHKNKVREKIDWCDYYLCNYAERSGVAICREGAVIGYADA